MPKRAQFFSELGGEGQYGVLLVSQIGGAPGEIQFLVETAEYDASVEGLRPKNGYIIRALGVRESRASVGVFAHAALAADHPLLYHHNHPRLTVSFTGTPASVSDLALDLSQAYVSTFLEWRHLVEMPEDFNRTMPLIDLLASGGGVLGTMPRPLANRVTRLLERHGLTVTTEGGPEPEKQDDHGRSTQYQVLMLDHSYVIALDFSFDAMRRS
ncbi:MAG: hypothetical protein KME04_12620 [Pleurocapsa minor GSE-CHR-MK-17-07R]|jgi:hypothetical protein|nr:hypothetical protein [Pleurocapsa minor GSE-CHR-MK 17-07R]